MTGFRNFILRGNLVDLAVAVILGVAFGAVVAAFTAWLTKTIGGDDSDFFTGGSGTFGFFLNAVISFVILAAVVYFFVVVPYTKAKEKFFPSPEPGTPEDIKLLQEIRDLLAAQSGSAPPAPDPSLS
jgi:large conductance mechanosensitive channel